MASNQETREMRQQMAVMHDSILEKLEAAMKNKEYVEASWLCYSIFEQRITRIIQKHLRKCPKQNRSKSKKDVGISTRIDCIIKLSKICYGAYTDVDYSVFMRVKKWCKRRNILVHGLLNINCYRKYDEAFKSLAEDGYNLIPLVYSEATKVRDWCNLGNDFPRFPAIKCQCKDQRCIHEEV